MWTAEQLYIMTMRESAAVLSLRGYGHVRAEELAKAANMSVGSFYRRYGSKDGFASMARRWFDNELCRVARVDLEMGSRPSGGDFRQLFDGFFRDMAWCAMSKPELFCYTFMHWHPDSLQPQAPGEEARAMVREVLAQGEREGALAPGSARVGEGLIWGALAELVRALARRDASVSEADVDAAARALWRALAAAEEDPSPRDADSPPLPGVASSKATASGPPASASGSVLPATHPSSEEVSSEAPPMEGSAVTHGSRLHHSVGPERLLPAGNHRLDVAAGRAEGFEAIVEPLRNPHQSETGPPLGAPPAFEEGLPAVEPGEWAAVLDEPGDPERTPAQARIVAGELAVLPEPVSDVHGERAGHGGRTYSIQQAFATRA